MPWAWLNPEVAVIEKKQQHLRAELDQLASAPSAQSHEHAGFHSGFAPQPDSIRWVQVDLGAEHRLDAVVVVPAMFGSAGAYGFPRRFRVDASNDPLFAESTTLLDQTSTDVTMPLAPWHIAARGVKARHVRFTATQLVPQPRLSQRYIFCLGEMLVFSGGQNIALHADVLAPKSVETLPTWSPKHLVDGRHALGLPVRPDEKHGNGWHSEVSSTAEATKWVQLDLGEARDVAEIRLIPAHPPDYPDRFGFGFPRRFKVEADDRTIIDHTSADFTNPGDLPAAFPTPGLRAQTIRITATRLWERSGDFVFALAEVQAFSAGQNIALKAAVTSADDTLTPAWTREHLVDGRSSSGLLVDESLWLAELSKRRQMSHDLSQLDLAHAAALRISQTRFAWLGIAVMILGIAMAGLVIWRLRRSRRREMEALRQRISRDLHDDIGSHLGSIRLMSELALREGGDSESLEEIHRLAGQAAESMRGIIWLVREGDAPKLMSLVEAMRQSAATLLTGIHWKLVLPTSDNAATASLEFHRQVFLLFREAAHNIARHAKASQVKIQIFWQSKRFHLHMEDDGCGFDVNAITAGNGLSNLRHRAEVIGGILRITSEPEKGTHITLETPLS